MDKSWWQTLGPFANTNDHRQYCHVGNTAPHCRCASFQDSDFAGDIEESISTSGGILFIFRCRATVHGRWRKDRRRACAGEIEASEFDIEKILREFNLSCWIRVCHTTRWNVDWVGILISQANQGEIEMKTQCQVPKCGTDMTILFSIYREIGARGESALKYREIGARRTESTHRGENEPPQSRDPEILDRWRKSSRMFDKSWIVQKTTR